MLSQGKPLSIKQKAVPITYYYAARKNGSTS